MYTTANICIHVTSAEAIESILKEGLQPRIGPLSEQVEATAAVYMFPSWDKLEDANWLFDEEAWPYDSEPALLAVDTRGLVLYSPQPYEVIVEDLIEPSRLTVLAPGESNWHHARKRFIELGGLASTNPTSEKDLKRSELANGLLKNDSGMPLVLFHGTSAGRPRFRGFTTWASTVPDLATQYSELRGLDGSEPLVVPLMMRAESTFDADRLPDCLTIADFVQELAAQGVDRGSLEGSTGENLTAELRSMAQELWRLARVEESGPHYSRHNFWHEPECFFGQEGALIIREIFNQCGFDSISMHEQGHLTYGVLEASQIIELNPNPAPKKLAVPSM